MAKKMKTKNKTVSLRLSEELYSKLSMKAKSLNIEKSDFLRQTIVGTKINANIDTKSLAQCLGRLNHISMSIESIAIALNDANLERQLGNKSYEKLLDVLSQIKAQIRSMKCSQR